MTKLKSEAGFNRSCFPALTEKCFWCCSSNAAEKSLFLCFVNKGLKMSIFTAFVFRFFVPETEQRPEGGSLSVVSKRNAER